MFCWSKEEEIFKEEAGKMRAGEKQFSSQDKIRREKFKKRMKWKKKLKCKEKRGEVKDIKYQIF